MQFRIISGGQAGVDRAALDVALALGIPCGGWCPLGRLAEDGPIDARYPLTEMQTADYPARTRKNVQESGGTLILTVGEPTGGTLLTVRECWRQGVPYCVVDLAGMDDRNYGYEVCAVSNWFRHEVAKAVGVSVLNVAGPRESKRPGVHDQASVFLREVFGLILPIKKE